MEKSMRRAFRRRQAAVKAKRRAHYSPGPHTALRRERLREQPKGCSCAYCGNPRRHASSHKDRVTVSERRTLITLREAGDDIFAEFTDFDSDDFDDWNLYDEMI